MKKFLVILLFGTISVSVQAQIRHVRGIKSIDAQYGITQFGTTLSASYVTYKSNTSYLKGGFFYESGKGRGVQYKSMGASAFFAKTLLSNAPKFYLNGIIGGQVSVDSAQPLVDFNVPTTFKGGIIAGIEGEVFINDRFVFIATATQAMLLGANFGNYRWDAKVGLRYVLFR